MAQYVVHGLTRSFFTRKVTGYLDHTDRPWRLEAGYLAHADALEAGWNGGIPVVTTPDGVPMWDSTSIIEHLDGTSTPSMRVLPDDPTIRFLAFFLDDYNDEWFYRPAVGSRWSFDENATVAGWQIAEEMSIVGGRPAAEVRSRVVDMMTSSMPRLGVTAANIDAWMNEVLVPWLTVLDRHLQDHPFLLGGRPSIADFAIFGANGAHFMGDPYCRAIADEHGPAVVEHTHRLLLPGRIGVGDWFEPDEIPSTLIDIVADAGRHYLPWVARATPGGEATVDFEHDVTAHIASTPFLDSARGVMLGRYVAARSDELDRILDRAGVLGHYADFVDRAAPVPDVSARSQPTDNRPYPAR